MPDTEWPVNGTPAKLIPEQPQTSGSDVTYLLTTLQQRITCVRLPDPHLTALQPPFPHRSPRRSSTNAACGGLIPSPAGRHRRANHPSSIAQHRIKKLGLHQTPFCVRDTRSLDPLLVRRLRRPRLSSIYSYSTAVTKPTATRLPRFMFTTASVLCPSQFPLLEVLPLAGPSNTRPTVSGRGVPTFRTGA
jgi:hypothetical protein